MTFKAIDRRLEGKTLLKQCQLAEQYILDIFVEVCDALGLQYYLDSGTLLGAVRHGGFIPWDDDIDVCMPIKDFKVFLKRANEYLPDNLLLESPKFFLGHPETFAKLRDRSSFFCEKHTNVQSPCGIYIDIFPVEKFPQSPKWLIKKISNWGTVAHCSYDSYLQLDFSSSRSLFVAAVKSFVWHQICHVLTLAVMILGILPTKKWRYCQGIGFVFQLGIEEGDLFPLSKVEFEGRKYFAPHRPEALLESYYGDWRKLPPPEKRQWHASIICPTQAPDAPWARKWEGSDI